MTERKKISLQEAIKQKLADKKKEAANQKGGFSNKASDQPRMKSQTSKKVNNMNRRTGGS